MSEERTDPKAFMRFPFELPRSRSSFESLWSVARCGPAVLGSLVGVAGLSVNGAESATEELAPMVVRGEAEYEGVSQEPFLPPIAGTQVYGGKKASVIDLDDLPKVQANNYRQALISTPGLLYSEETTPLVSLGYRGIGEPHRMQYLQVLKDGIPIHADPYGYPEAYYTPPLDVVDRLEFVRGGASLMYGPQPAGALNYVTYRPRRDRAFSGRTYHTFGSDDLYSTYTAVDGTSGPLGYLGYYNHRQAEGFRASNSDYRLDGGHFKLVYDVAPGTTAVLGFDAYEEEHGEPGGLTLANGPGLANYRVDRNQSTRLHDRFELRRYVPSLELGHEFDEDTRGELRVWGGYYDRFSRRQRGGGFGSAPVGPLADSNAIERQEFYSFGSDARVRHDYYWGGKTQTLTGGLYFHRSDSPRTDKIGAAADATDGVVSSRSQRDVYAGAAFAENRFAWGDFSVTPGLRLETVAQEVQVDRPLAGGGTVSTLKSGTAVEPLYGLSTAYVLPRHTELYASVAKSFRPRVFTESVIPASGAVIAGDVDPTTTWMYEVGYRGEPTRWLRWDTSLFWVDMDNRFGGTVTAGGVTQLRSVGRSINRGWDAATEVDLEGVARALRGEADEERAHRVAVHASLTLLDAEIHGGTQDGRVPQYAPEVSLRSGVVYRWKDRAKVAFLGTHVSDHYATDDENPARLIPSYISWDLTTEFKVYRDTVSVVGGINNLFDEDYYARIRPDGIDPAYRRNFYAGVQVSF